MLQAGVSANLMSLGALDFGLIVDGAVIIVENALRRIAERAACGAGGAARPGASGSQRRPRRAREMIRPSVYRAGDHHARLRAAAHPDRRRRQDVRADGAHRHHGAGLRLPAVAHLRAGGDRRSGLSRPVGGEAESRDRGLAPAVATNRASTAPCARPTRDDRRSRSARSALGGAAFTMLGQEFLPQLDEGDVLVSAFRVPGTSVEQSQKMQSQIEQALAGMPEIRTVFSRTGTAEVASDPMPPNATDTFIMLKDRKRMAEPERQQGRRGRSGSSSASPHVPGHAL